MKKKECKNKTNLKEGCTVVHVWAKPGSKVAKVEGWALIDEIPYLKIKVASPPQNGKANKELGASLAQFFQISQSRVRLIRGEKSTKKVFFIGNNDP